MRGAQSLNWNDRFKYMEFYFEMRADHQYTQLI